MNTLADEINAQISAGRRTIERSLEEMKDLEMPRVPPGLVAAGAVTAIVALGLVGWMVYRSRRRRTLVQRVQEALPEGVREFPQGIRAQVKRAK